MKLEIVIVIVVALTHHGFSQFMPPSLSISSNTTIGQITKDEIIQLVWESMNLEDDYSSKFNKEIMRVINYLYDNMPHSHRNTIKIFGFLSSVEYVMKGRNLSDLTKEVPFEIFLYYVVPYWVLQENQYIFFRKKHFSNLSESISLINNYTELVLKVKELAFNSDLHFAEDELLPFPNDLLQSTSFNQTRYHIVLIMLFRTIGIPARLVGTLNWNIQQYHYQNLPSKTWVEVWTGGWSFLNSTDANLNSINQTDFMPNPIIYANKSSEFGIFAATSFEGQKNIKYFPMDWDINNKNVPAIQVTDYYLEKANSYGF